MGEVRMDELLRALQSPLWWVGVVLVGLIVQVASVYLKTGLDSLLSRLSSRWATARHGRREAFEREVQEARVSSEKRAALRFRHLRRLVEGIIFMLLGVGCFSATLFWPSPARRVMLFAVGSLGFLIGLCNYVFDTEYAALKEAEKTGLLPSEHTRRPA